MKNKDKYDLRKIELSVSYLIDGCGHKIEPPRFITILYDNEKIGTERTNESAFRYIMNWLEKENEEKK